VRLGAVIAPRGRVQSVGFAEFTLAPGKERAIRFRVGARQIRQIRRAGASGVRLRLRATVFDGNQRLKTRTLRLRVTAPRPR
jgi:hypothetical protein